MKKKILLSLGTLIFIGALAASATGAFFSDTETSTGNTFSAGAIDLTVDSTSHYDGLVCVANEAGGGFHWAQEPNASTTVRAELIGTPCTGTWTATNLGPTNQFFNFTDVKPGDNGEDTISMHVDNNPAWACADIQTTSNAENVATGPELAAGDTTANGNFDGELAQNIQVFAWLDNASTSGAVPGDNIWQAGEQKLTPTPVAMSAILGTTTLPLADSVTNGGAPLLASSTSYIGLAWCAGTMNTSVAGVITCDGAGMDNKSQTDSATADITLRVSQQRNQPNFVCGSGTGTTTPPNTIVVTQSNLATTTAGALAGNWFFYNDSNDTVMTLDQFSGTGGQDHMDTIASEAGAKMVLDSGVDPRYNIATGQFGGTLLSAISSLKFRVYDATVDSDTPFLGFNVDFATTTITGYQNRLTMQPGSSTNAPLAPATWTTVDAIGGGTEMWTWSGFAKGPDKIASTADDNTWPDGNTNQYRTWNSIVTAFPNAKLLTPGSFLGVRDGQPGPAGATDYVSSIEFNGTTYNFEL